MIYYISHHGIEGQKWGVQNGPPYPLDSAKMSSEERRASNKERAIKEGDLRYARRHKRDFSNSEIDRLVDRYQHTKKIDDMNFDDTDVDRYLNKTGKRLKTVATITGSVIALGVFYEKVTGKPIWRKITG